MPTATAKPAPTGKFQTKTITTVVTDPVEKPIEAPVAPAIEPQEDFWKYIQSLTPDDWKHHHVSLYRYPLGQTKPQKLGRYVKTYKNDAPLLSEDQIFDEFGGSQYDALLRGPAGDGTGRITLIAKHSWEMDGPAKNPWATSAPNASTPPGPSELASTLQVVLQNLQTAQKLPNAAESPAIKESISLIQQLTAAMPKPQGVGELVSALSDLKKLTGGGDEKNHLLETVKFLKEIGVIGAERKSLAKEIKDILEIAGMVGGGGGGGEKKDWATTLIENAPTILDKITPIADKFADASRNNARVAEIRSGAVPPRALPPGPQQPTQKAEARPTAEPPSSETPAAPRVVAPPETEPVEGAIVFKAPNLEWVKGRAAQLFASGKAGDEVAEWLDLIDPQLGNFLGSMDEPKFTEFVKTDPILGQIASAPRFPQFVKDFVEYFAAAESPAETETAPA
jgi:hypothetical protein